MEDSGRLGCDDAGSPRFEGTCRRDLVRKLHRIQVGFCKYFTIFTLTCLTGICIRDWIR
jgi:hypothetical protein